MDNLNHITDLQAVDFALGAVFARCFAACSPTNAPKAFQRFLARTSKEKIFYVKNGGIKLHQLWKSVIWHMEERSCKNGGSEATGERIMLEKDQEKKIKKTGETWRL